MAAFAILGAPPCVEFPDIGFSGVLTPESGGATFADVGCSREGKELSIGN